MDARRSSLACHIPAIDEAAPVHHQPVSLAPRLAVEVSEHESIPGHRRRSFFVVPLVLHFHAIVKPAPGASAILRLVVELEQPRHLNALIAFRHPEVQVVRPERAALSIDHALERPRVHVEIVAICDLRQGETAGRTDGKT